MAERISPPALLRDEAAPESTGAGISAHEARTCQASSAPMLEAMIEGYENALAGDFDVETPHPPPASSREDDIRVLDAACWVKGCSSLGRLRFAVLLEVDGGEGAPDICFLDIKEAI